MSRRTYFRHTNRRLEDVEVEQQAEQRMHERSDCETSEDEIDSNEHDTDIDVDVDEVEMLDTAWDRPERSKPSPQMEVASVFL